MKERYTQMITMVVILGIFISGACGYILNFFKVILLIGKADSLNTLFAGRIFGIFFPPLGAILGWIN